MQSDVDCVYFINDEAPPFDEILKEFYDICNNPDAKNLFDTFSMKMNKNSINLEIDGVEMNVVVATNFVNKQKKRRSLHLVQQREVLKRIEMNPAENCYKFSSALAEASVHFMKSQNGFANEIARIAKYWFQSLDRGFDHISGASTFIELVAVHTARRKYNFKKKLNPHVKAFMKFLEVLINFENLDVSFGITVKMLQKHLLPCVIDPVNPYNNYARYWSENVSEIDAIKSSAVSTLKRLEKLILSSHLEGSASDEYLIETIFHP